ncbi:hypothetical protein [uncultured Pontibacter sp.]|uniref:hypothetical protein n=1 Tax=uncultured Pontibacter sp. TaxID=453356 RepID=UPI002607FC33|nr:hypothetical protein [uncultured Pontibacter sp.]
MKQRSAIYQKDVTERNVSRTKWGMKRTIFKLNYGNKRGISSLGLASILTGW